MQVNQHDNTTVFSWDSSDPTCIDFRNLVKGTLQKHAISVILSCRSICDQIIGAKTRFRIFRTQYDITKNTVLKSFVVVVGTMSVI